MTSQHKHLVFGTTEEREAASRLPVWERQRIIENLRVPYYTYNRGLATIGQLHRPVEGGLPSRGVIGGLLGESHCGKSVVCQAYVDQFPPRDGDTGMEFPVVYVDASVGISRKRVGDKVHRATAAQHRILSREDPSEWTIDRLLKCKTELLIVDDAQFLFFEQRNSQTATEMYGLVKDVLDTHKMSVLLVGYVEIDTFVRGIAALKNRAYRSETLRPLGTSSDELKSFGHLLTSIDRRLPFRELSRLEEHRDHFHLYSSGQIGLIMNIVRDASYFALNAQSACILVEHLREAVRTRVEPGDDKNYFGYKRPRRP